MEAYTDIKSLITVTPEEFAMKNGRNDEGTQKVAIEKLKQHYVHVQHLLRKYCDIKEEYYPLLSLWTVGTYMHSCFNTYPLCFLNATKGSGKTRLMKLILSVAHSGKLVLDLREAVLFRTAKGNTIGIDEFEGMASKEAGTLRTLINAAYKRGGAVERMKKVTKNGQEEQVVERFDLYTPVIMANIWGVEEVVQDRCLVFILEKSANPSMTKLMEDYETNSEIRALKSSLNLIQCSLCSVVTGKNIDNWNNYISTKYTLYTQHTYMTQYPLTAEQQIPTFTQEEITLYDKIDKSGLNGRNLELFFPLFIIANLLGEKEFDEVLAIAATIVNEKRTEELAESKDVALLDFISNKQELRGAYVSMLGLLNEFKLAISLEEAEQKWMNAHWVGRSLKRMGLIIQKRRTAKGVEAIIDIDKAIRKLHQQKAEISK